MRSQETLRRLAVIDEGFETVAGLGPAAASALDPKTAALRQWRRRWPSGRPRCAGMERLRVLAAGATEDEIAGVLLAIAPVAGLGRVVSAAPDAGALRPGMTSQ